MKKLLHVSVLRIRMPGFKNKKLKASNGNYVSPPPTHISKQKSKANESVANI